MILTVIASDDFDVKKLSLYAWGAFGLYCSRTGNHITIPQDKLYAVNEIVGVDADDKPAILPALLAGGAISLATDSFFAGLAGAYVGGCLSAKKMHILQLVFDDGRSLIIKASQKDKQKLSKHAKTKQVITLAN